MMLPTVHLNGTSLPALQEQGEAAMLYLGLTIALLEDMAPNARDYYPQGDGAFAKAAAEHQARLGKLVEVRGEVETILQHLYAAQARRDEQRHGR